MAEANLTESGGLDAEAAQERPVSGPLHMHCALVKSVRFSSLAGPSVRLQKLGAQFPLQVLVLMPAACCSLFLLLAACTTGAQVQGPVLSGPLHVSR